MIIFFLITNNFISIIRKKIFTKIKISPTGKNYKFTSNIDMSLFIYIYIYIYIQ